MSKLRRADYTQFLRGKVVERVHWNNEDDWKCLTIVFTDKTLCSFRFSLTVDEECELSDFHGGNLTNDRRLTPTPIMPRGLKDETTSS